MKKLNKFVQDRLEWFIVTFVALVCASFLILGYKTENGYITLDSKDAVITDTTKEWIEDANEALNRIMNGDKPTDEATIAENDEEATGQGFHTTINDILGRRLADGNNDNGNGWQCSRYTGYLATGKWSYSSSHPDYGPVNGKAVAEWLVKNYGFKYIGEPVQGAIGSGGFNTLYGHTVMYLYSTGTNTAMVNDANWTPLKVSTHNMNISGYVWVVPGDYEPEQPTPTPEPTPAYPDEPGIILYTYKKGDTFGQVITNLGLKTKNGLWGTGRDVEFYTGQLHEQGIYGNIPIGTTIKLTPRQ